MYIFKTRVYCFTYVLIFCAYPRTGHGFPSEIVISFVFGKEVVVLFVDIDGKC